MNTRRKAGEDIGGTDAGVIQVPSWALASGIQIHVNPAGLRDGEVRRTFVQMAQASTLQAQAIRFD